MSSKSEPGNSTFPFHSWPAALAKILNLPTKNTSKKAQLPTITTLVRKEIYPKPTCQIPLSSNATRPAGPVKGPQIRFSHRVTRQLRVHPDSFHCVSPCPLCSGLSLREKKKAAAMPPLPRTENLLSPYRPAAAPAAIGIIPAIFIPSIRARTFSTLAPVSVHASTYGCRLPSACITSTLISACTFFTAYGR